MFVACLFFCHYLHYDRCFCSVIHNPDKIDAFALGAVIYELLICKKLEDLSSTNTLAQFISDGPGLEAAMTLGHMVLPWLPPNNMGNAPYVGYIHEL